MLSAQAMQTLSAFQDNYENQIMQQLNATSAAVASLRFQSNRFYLETALENYTEDELMQNRPEEIVNSLIHKKLLSADAIEYGRAIDAVKILRHYLLTRPDV